MCIPRRPVLQRHRLGRYMLTFALPPPQHPHPQNTLINNNHINHTTHLQQWIDQHQGPPEDGLYLACASSDGYVSTFRLVVWALPLFLWLCVWLSIESTAQRCFFVWLCVSLCLCLRLLRRLRQCLWLGCRLFCLAVCGCMGWAGGGAVSCVVVWLVVCLFVCLNESTPTIPHTPLQHIHLKKKQIPRTTPQQVHIYEHSASDNAWAELVRLKTSTLGTNAVR